MALATAGVFAASPPAAAQTPGCEGDACRVLTPFLRALTGAGPNCRYWVDVKFWKRAAAKDVQRCIARGYRANAEQRGGVSVLLLAAHNGKAETVQALIEAGADIEKGSRRHGSTPLHAAAYVGNAETLEVLIAAGAQIEAKEKRGHTPLHAAAAGGRAATARILLASGARTDTRDRVGQTPADLAMSAGKTSVARIIRAARTRVAATPKPETRTARAATAPKPDRTPKVRPNAATGGQGCGGWLAADFWRRAGEADVRRCLAAGSRLDARNARGSTPLHWAAYVNNAAAVKALVAAGAKVDARDARSRTPTHSAASGGSEAAVRALIAAGADVSARSSGGLTPADEARSKHQVRIASLLGGSSGRAGASPPPARKTVAPKSAADRAVQVFEKTKRRSESPKRKLYCNPGYKSFWKKALPEDIRRCAKDRTLKLLHGAALLGASFEQVAAALEAGADPEVKEYGYTALYLAVERGQKEVVKALLAGGANVNARHDKTSTHIKRWTALHVASSNSQMAGRAELVKMLLAAGAKVDLKDSWSQTALHIASRSYGEGGEKAVKMLLAAGAKVDVRDRKGRTPMDVAHTKNIKRLLMAGGAGPPCKDWNTAEYWKKAMAKHVRRCISGGKQVSRLVRLKNGGIGVLESRLDLAAFHGSPEAVRALIEAGAKVDAKAQLGCKECIYKSDGQVIRYKGGGTALHLAVLNGKTANAKALIAAGADITVRDKNQLTPLELAKAMGKAEVAEILSDAQEKQNERMRAVAQDCGNWRKPDFWQYGSAADVKRCVRAGSKVGARDKVGATRLHLAAHYGNVEMMKALISAGARIEARREDGRTPLHIAAQRGTPGAVDALLDAKANAKAKTREGKFPFDLAKAGNKRLQGTDAYWRLNEALHE